MVLIDHMLYLILDLYPYSKWILDCTYFFSLFQQPVSEVDRFGDMQLGTDGMFLCMFICK